MNNKKIIILTLVLLALFLTSACGTNANNGSTTGSGEQISDENPQEILELYIQAIANQDAEKLVELYGGSYQSLMNIFPETDPNDKQKLFEQYLERISKISLKEIVEQSEVSKDEFKFVITFKEEDGALFQTREFDIITDKFTYTVTRVSGKLKVMELPPYQA